MTEHTHTAAALAIPVERLRPGDHTCMVFTEADAHWEVLAGFTRTGLARREKVLVGLEPGDLRDDDAVARLDGGTGQVSDAYRSGQFSLRPTTSIYLPDGRFDKERTLRTFAAEIARSREEGYPSLRGAADMGWAARAGVDDSALAEYESSARSLFTAADYAAICWYDRRQFGDVMIAAQNQIHPLRVMEHLGMLEVSTTANGMRIAGSAELGTRERFAGAAREAAQRCAREAPLRFELDLTDLIYADAHSAWQLIEFATTLPEHHKAVLRCGPMLGMTLRALGSDDVPQLELVVEETEDLG